jgi:hypothetical protein
MNKIVAGKPGENRPLGRPTRVSQDNIKVDLRGIRLEPTHCLLLQLEMFSLFDPFSSCLVREVN